jgi:hypothetical protein
MTRALPFTKASVRRAIAAAQAAGLRVTGIGPDGTVLTGDALAGLVPCVGADGQNDPYVAAVERVDGKTQRKRYVRS